MKEVFDVDLTVRGVPDTILLEVHSKKIDVMRFPSSSSVIIFCFLIFLDTRPVGIMQAQRNAMRLRVAKRFARVPAQHGDAYYPMYYPVPVNSSNFGTPWAKVPNKYHSIFVTCIGMPLIFYYYTRHFGNYKLRVSFLGRRPWWTQKMLRFTDIDDPDHEIKWNAMKGEYERGETIVTWGGTNMIASWLWEPGDPEPDKRRRAPPEGAH